MTFVVGATWTAVPGHEEAVVQILTELAAATVTEEGNQSYRATQSVDDSQVFFLFEVYNDEDAYLSHSDSEHFARLVKNDAIPNHLASRERLFLRPIQELSR